MTRRWHKTLLSEASVFLRAYLRNTTVHGFSYLAGDGRAWWESLFWLAGISTGLAATVFMLITSFQVY